MSDTTFGALLLLLGFGGLVAIFWDHVVAAVKRQFQSTGRHHAARGALSTAEEVGARILHTGGLHRRGWKVMMS